MWKDSPAATKRRRSVDDRHGEPPFYSTPQVVSPRWLCRVCIRASADISHLSGSPICEIHVSELHLQAPMTTNAKPPWPLAVCAQRPGWTSCASNKVDLLSQGSGRARKAASRIREEICRLRNTWLMTYLDPSFVFVVLVLDLAAIDLLALARRRDIVRGTERPLPFFHLDDRRKGCSRGRGRQRHGQTRGRRGARDGGRERLRKQCRDCR